MNRNHAWIVAVLTWVVLGCATPSSHSALKVQPRTELNTLVAESLFQGKQEVLSAWVVYGTILLSRMKEANNQYTFEADLEACKAMLTLWRDEKGEDADLRDELVDAMLAADEAGFLNLKEYVWNFHKDPSWAAPQDLRPDAFESWRHTALGKVEPKKKVVVIPLPTEEGADPIKVWVGQ